MFENFVEISRASEEERVMKVVVVIEELVSTFCFLK